MLSSDLYFWSNNWGPSKDYKILHCLHKNKLGICIFDWRHHMFLNVRILHIIFLIGRNIVVQHKAYKSYRSLTKSYRDTRITLFVDYIIWCFSMTYIIWFDYSINEVICMRRTAQLYWQRDERKDKRRTRDSYQRHMFKDSTNIFKWISHAFRLLSVVISQLVLSQIAEQLPSLVSIF